jgi:hypothetical protein
VCLMPYHQPSYSQLRHRSDLFMQHVVLHMYKGLTQLAVTGADASCIYLEYLSFSLSSLCILVYTHGSPHTVTCRVKLQPSDD